MKNSPLERTAPVVLFDLRWVRSNRLDGIGRFSLELLQQMSRLSPERVFHALYTDEDVRESLFHTLNSNVRLVRTRHGLFSPLNGYSLSAVIRRLSPGALFSPNYLAFPPISTGRAIHIAVVHDIIPWELREARDGNLRWRLFYSCPPLGRFLLRKSPDHIIAVSEKTADSIASFTGIDPNRISIVPGAPASEFHPEKEGDKEVLAALGVKSPYLLFVGRNDRHKNLGRLLRAYTSLPGALQTRYPLVVAGAAGRKTVPTPNIIPLPAAEGKDLPALYRGAALLLLPSLAEGFGLPVVEAFACGTPALVSDRPPMTDIGGEGARFFDPESVKDIARVIRETLEDPEALALLASKTKECAARFSWEKSARLTLDLIDRAVKERA